MYQKMKGWCHVLKNSLIMIITVLKRIFIVVSSICFIFALIICTNKSFIYNENLMVEKHIIYFGNYKCDYLVLCGIISIHCIPICIFEVIINIIKFLYNRFKKREYVSFRGIVLWCMLLILHIVSSYVYFEFYIMQFGV